MAPSPYIFIINIGPVDMNQYARFDKIKILRKQNVTDERTEEGTDGRTDNLKTVYPPTNTVCKGYSEETAGHKLPIQHPGMALFRLPILMVPIT